MSQSDAWATEHPENENGDCLCRIGMVWGCTKQFPMWLLGVHVWYNIFGACKCASASQFQLWVASISLERRRTFVLLCKCYPTVLAIGWRGEIMPLYCPSSQNTAVQNPPRAKAQHGKCSPQRWMSQKVMGKWKQTGLNRIWLVTSVPVVATRAQSRDCLWQAESNPPHTTHTD